ncbi:MAG: adenylate kinase [Actinobacteria bacterium]|nr:adenylate kinase [Actinomycetota bacterium]
MRLVIFGPQGAGKGTQAARISEKFGISAISTGEIFRWAIKGKTALGNEVLEYVSAGKLVPDELTIRVVSERIAADDCAEGFLLDGFPRNTAQAEALDDLLSDVECGLDAALVIEVPEEVALRRLTGRRVCPDCGRNYHVDAPPENNWTCDACGGHVVARDDDVDEAALKQRLATYHEQTEPLHEYYEAKGLLRQVDGTGTPDEVFTRIVEALG